MDELDQPIHFCGNVESFRVTGKLCPIPSETWTWWLEGRFPGLADGHAEVTLQNAFSTWGKVCKHKPRQAVTRDSANVLIRTGPIDGALGILAQAHMYTGQKQQLLQFDLEKFVETFDVSQGWIGLPHVAAHEWGHIILLPHLDFDGTPDLMNPTYNAAIWEPQADEAGIARKALGAPEVAPAPPSATGPGEVSIEKLRINVGGVFYECSGKARRVA